MISILDVEELKRPLLINILALYNDKKVKLEKIGSLTCLNVNDVTIYLTVEESFLDSKIPNLNEEIITSTINYLKAFYSFDESNSSQ